MRLINADDFIERLGSSDREIYFKELIEEQPKAYDVEAVVKEIEEWNKVTGALPEHSTWYYELISIIERGGVK